MNDVLKSLQKDKVFSWLRTLMWKQLDIMVEDEFEENRSATGLLRLSNGTPIVSASHGFMRTKTLQRSGRDLLLHLHSVSEERGRFLQRRIHVLRGTGKKL